MMKRLTIITICLLAFTGLSAQELANFAGRQPVISPEIKGSEITFRISAPYADAVNLSGSWAADMRSAIEMTKDGA